jgi:hypothetical protein
MRRDQESQDTQLGTVPKFKRVRKITRCGEPGTLLCDCCYFDRVGIPCRHIIALLDHILGDEFKGITVDDVRVFWRKDYFFYGMQPQNEMRSLLMALRNTDTQGPVLPSGKLPSTIFMNDYHPIVRTYHLPLTERCMNYSQIHCQQALERYGNTSCPSNHGISQEVYDYSINDDGGNDFEAGNMCDVFDYPSPQKKPTAEKKELAYEAILQFWMMPQLMNILLLFLRKSKPNLLCRLERCLLRNCPSLRDALCRVRHPPARD